MMSQSGRRFVLVGGSGFIGTAVTEVLLDAGASVVTVDRNPPRSADPNVGWVRCDPLVDDPDLPDGHVVILLGGGNPRPRWPWTLAWHTPLATARVAPLLAGRTVTLLSSVEVYGEARPPLREDTAPELRWGPTEVARWCEEAAVLARSPCPPWRAIGLCRRMVDADPTGRWTYALAKVAQEQVVSEAGTQELTVLRLANAYGLGQERVMSRWVRAALADRPLFVTDNMRSFVPVAELGRVLLAGPGPGVFNVASPSVHLHDLAEQVVDACRSSSTIELLPVLGPDNCGIVDPGRLRAIGIQIEPPERHLAAFVGDLVADDRPLVDPPMPVVVPPRPVNPDEVAERMQECLWTGALKHGNRWSIELGQRLAKELEVDDDHEVLLTTSGTDALRLIVGAIVGPADPGEVALLPSFTFPATAEVLVQLGYQLGFVDVDEHTWTLDRSALEQALTHQRARVVMTVDTFGNPCDYEALDSLCSAAGAVLLADSAAAIGTLYRGCPVGGQAAAHAYSMSFAKVLSAGGAGGAAVLPTGAVLDSEAGWTRSALMNELHAIVALDQLTVLDDLVHRRGQVAGVYQEAAARLGLEVQTVLPGNRHSFVHFVVRVAGGPGRQALADRLARLGVQTKPYFSALHQGRVGASCLEVTERLDAEALALPMSSEMTEDDAERVVIALERCL